MNDKTLLLIAAGGLAVWYLTSRPAVASPAASVPPPQPWYGTAAGYAPPANYPTDPGDRNSWAPAIAAGIGALGNIASAAINRGTAATTSGTYNDPYASSVADGGWSDPGF